MAELRVHTMPNPDPGPAGTGFSDSAGLFRGTRNLPILGGLMSLPIPDGWDPKSVNPFRQPWANFIREVEHSTAAGQIWQSLQPIQQVNPSGYDVGEFPVQEDVDPEWDALNSPWITDAERRIPGVITSTSRRKAMAVIERWRRSNFLSQSLQAEGGIGSMLIAQLADPLTYVPIPMAKGLGFVKGFRRTALMGGALAVPNEALRISLDPNADTEELFYGVMGSALLVGALGGMVGGLSSDLGVSKRLSAALDRAQQRFDQGNKTSKGSPETGAQAVRLYNDEVVDNYQEMVELGDKTGVHVRNVLGQSDIIEAVSKARRDVKKVLDEFLSDTPMTQEAARAYARRMGELLPDTDPMKKLFIDIANREVGKMMRHFYRNNIMKQTGSVKEVLDGMEPYQRTIGLRALEDVRHEMPDQFRSRKERRPPPKEPEVDPVEDYAHFDEQLDAVVQAKEIKKPLLKKAKKAQEDQQGKRQALLDRQGEMNPDEFASKMRQQETAEALVTERVNKLENEMLEYDELIQNADGFRDLMDPRFDEANPPGTWTSFKQFPYMVMKNNSFTGQLGAIMAGLADEIAGNPLQLSGAKRGVATNVSVEAKAIVWRAQMETAREGQIQAYMRYINRQTGTMPERSIMLEQVKQKIGRGAAREGYVAYDEFDELVGQALRNGDRAPNAPDPNVKTFVEEAARSWRKFYNSAEEEAKRFGLFRNQQSLQRHIDSIENSIAQMQSMADSRQIELDRLRSLVTGKQEVFPDVDVEVRYGEIGDDIKKPRADGTRVAAFRRTENGRDIIYIDRERLHRMWADKPWREAKVEGVHPLTEDFATPEDWINFVLAHEKSHVINRIKPGETRAQYENRTNRLALRELRNRTGQNPSRTLARRTAAADERVVRDFNVYLRKINLRPTDSSERAWAWYENYRGRLEDIVESSLDTIEMRKFELEGLKADLDEFLTANQAGGPFDKSYFMQVFDRNKLVSDPAGFKEVLYEHFQAIPWRIKDGKKVVYSTNPNHIQARVDETYNRIINAHELGDPEEVMRHTELLRRIESDMADLRVRMGDYKKLKFEEPNVNTIDGPVGELDAKGKPVLAKVVYKHDGEFDMFIDEAAIRSGFDEGSLPKRVMDEASTPDEAVKLYREHELAHTRLRRRPGEDPFDYEARINESAFKAFRTGERLDERTTQYHKRMAQLERMHARLMKDGPGGPSTIMRRSLNIPRDKLTPWSLNSAEDVAGIYSHRMAPMIEMARKFGDYRMTSQIDNIVAQANEQIDQVMLTDPAKGRKLMTELDRYVTATEALRDKVLGTYGRVDNPDGLFPRGVYFLKNWATMTMMGKATLAAVSDVGAVVLHTGLAPFFREFSGMLQRKAMGKALFVGMDDIRAAGLAREFSSSARVRAMFDLDGDFRGRTKLEKAAESGTNIMFIMNGLSGWTDFMQKFAGTIIVNNLLDTAGKMVKGTATPEEITRAAAAGMDNAFAARVYNQWQRAGSPMEDTTRIAATGMWDDADVTRRFRAIMNQEVYKAVIQPGAADKPLFMSNPLGGLIGHLKGFTFAMHWRVFSSAYRQLGERPAHVLSSLALIVSTAYFMNQVRAWISGYEDHGSLDEKLLDAIEGSGATGMFGELNSMLENSTGSTLGLRPSLGQSPKFGNPSAGTVLSPLGPVVSQWSNLAWALTSSEASDAQQTNAIKYMVPYQNMWFWSGMMTDLSSAARAR